MIFKWLMIFARKIYWLVRMPPESELAMIDVPRRDPNKVCPCCGGRNGTLRCIQSPNDKNELMTKCQHTCNICGCQHFEEPAINLPAAYVRPSIPRTDVEVRQDIAGKQSQRGAAGALN